MASASRLATAALLLAYVLGACEGRRTLTLFPDPPGGGDAGGDDRPASVRCDDSRDCPEELPSCDQGDHRCVACGPSMPCKTGFVCYLEDGDCEPVCDGDDDCKDEERRYCDVPSGRCVECLDRAPCPEWEPYCEMQTGRCGDCASDEDCGNWHCRPRDLECVQCLDNGDCDGDEECRRGECQR